MLLEKCLLPILSFVAGQLASCLLLHLGACV